MHLRQSSPSLRRHSTVFVTLRQIPFNFGCSRSTTPSSVSVWRSVRWWASRSASLPWEWEGQRWCNSAQPLPRLRQSGKCKINQWSLYPHLFHNPLPRTTTSATTVSNSYKIVLLSLKQGAGVNVSLSKIELNLNLMQYSRTLIRSFFYRIYPFKKTFVRM